MTRSRSRSPDNRDRRGDSIRTDRRENSTSHYKNNKDLDFSPRHRTEHKKDQNDRDRRDREVRSRSRSRSRSPERRETGGSKGKEKEKETNRRDRRRSRSRSRSRSPDRSRHQSSRRRSRSRSYSSSSGSDSNDRRSRKKKSSSSRDKLDSKGRDKEERRKRRQEKKDKRERRAKKKSGHAVVEWGKHGILVDSDIYTKNEEFRSWLLEEKRINADSLSKPKLKDIFREYMENYNTSTLPHDKYYDLAAYESKMNSLRMGETISNDDTYDFNKDMLAIQSQHKRVVVETATYLDKSKLEALRKLQNERVEMEKMKQMGLQIKDSMGIRTETKDEAGMR